MAIEQFIPEEHDIDWLIARRDRLERDRDALLEACKDIQAAPKRLDKREKMGDTVHITITRQQMKNINTAIALVEKEGKL